MQIQCTLFVFLKQISFMQDPMNYIFLLPSFKILHFSKQIFFNGLEENFAKIQLPNWQFYLPEAMEQLDIMTLACKVLDNQPNMGPLRNFHN